MIFPYVLIVMNCDDILSQTKGTLSVPSVCVRLHLYIVRIGTEDYVDIL